MLKNFNTEEYDIIIQAGQSNSEGYGIGTASVPYAPSQNVWYLNEDFTISLATEKVAGNLIQSNFSLAFSAVYIADGYLKEGRKLLILRAAVGGTGFLDNRWGLNDDLFLHMMEMIKTALSLNKNNKLIALLWHQGESDAMMNSSYETYYNNLSGLVNAVRTTFNVPNLPFVAGDFVQDWKNNNLKVCEPVISATKDICANIKNGKFVNTDNLLSNAQANVSMWDAPDNIHFTRESVYTLGREYFSALKEILEEK